MAFLGHNGYGEEEILLLFSIMMFDMATGILKSYALWTVGEKEYYTEDHPILNLRGKAKSTWFNTTVAKVGFFGKVAMLVFPAITIGVAHLLGRQIGGVSGFIVGILAGAELISIIQNLIVVKTKKPVQEVDAITFVLQSLLDAVKNQITNRLTTQPYKKDEQ